MVSMVVAEQSKEKTKKEILKENVPLTLSFQLIS